MKTIDIVTLIMHFGSDKHRISVEAAKKIAFFLWSVNYEYDNDFIESLGRYTVNVSAYQSLRSILTHKKIKNKSKYKTRQQAFTFFKNFLNMEVDLTPEIERRAYNYCTADALQYFKAYCWVYHNRLTDEKVARFGKNRKDSKFIEREWFELQADLYLNRDDRYDNYVSANPWGQSISRRIISTPMGGQNKR